jgi:hypothetical protein
MRSPEAEARRLARANATVRVFRRGESQAAEDEDARYWARIPVDSRAAFVWQLSLELHALAHPEDTYEPGLHRSITRIDRR